MKISSILLTTDFSQESERAFAPIVSMAKEAGATLHMLHVVQDVAVAPHGAPLAPPQHAPSVEKEIAEARESLDRQCELLAETGVAIEKAVITGENIAEAVGHYASEHGIDLIALSSHGRSGFKRLVLGSVAETILRHAHVPVMVFPRQD